MKFTIPQSKIYNNQSSINNQVLMIGKGRILKARKVLR